MPTLIELRMDQATATVSIEGDCMVAYTENGLQSLHFMESKDYWKYRKVRDSLGNPVPTIVEVSDSFRVEPETIKWSLPLVLDQLIMTLG